MNNVYYITKKELKDKIDEIVKDVLKNDSIYYLIIDNEPKVRIGPADMKQGKKAYVISEKDRDLKKFLE